MERNVTINGMNIYATWGAELTDGSLEVLLTPPPVKEYITNKSRLESGVRVTDIPKLRQWDDREIVLHIFVTGTSQSDYLAKYASFVNTLATGKLALGVPILGIEYVLFYISCTKYGNYGKCKGKFSLKFREPNIKDRKEI